MRQWNRPQFVFEASNRFFEPFSIEKTRSVLAVLRRFGRDMVWDCSIPSDVRRTLEKILGCRDGSYGSTYYRCPDCTGAKFVASPCNNRHCPACSWQQQSAWLDKVLSWKLTFPYYHIVFTAPHEFNSLIEANRHLLYDAFFRSSLRTVQRIAEDDFHCTPAIIQALHTWGQSMHRHVHIHMIASAGGLAYRPTLESKGSPGGRGSGRSTVDVLSRSILHSTSLAGSGASRTDRGCTPPVACMTIGV